MPNEKRISAIKARILSDQTPAGRKAIRNDPELMQAIHRFAVALVKG
jgi:hypothetical protein